MRGFKKIAFLLQKVKIPKEIAFLIEEIASRFLDGYMRFLESEVSKRNRISDQRNRISNDAIY
jgi:hypothetical protein